MQFSFIEAMKEIKTTSPSSIFLILSAYDKFDYAKEAIKLGAMSYLNKPLKASLTFESSDVPPIAEIEGVDLVTEGVITINKVLEYAKDYLKDNESYEQWCYKKDGASLISRLLFEEATDINFFVGRAINPAHQNPELPITFSIKMNLVQELSECLKKMGKRIKVSYF